MLSVVDKELSLMATGGGQISTVMGRNMTHCEILFVVDRSVKTRCIAYLVQALKQIAFETDVRVEYLKMNCLPNSERKYRSQHDHLTDR